MRIRNSVKELDIAVVGAGAVGQVFGGRLAAAGHRIFLVARADRVPAINEHGLRLRRHDGQEELIPVSGSAPALDSSKRWDYVLVAVRAEQLDEVLASLEHCGAHGRALVICTAIWGPQPSYRIRAFEETLVLSPGIIAGEVDGAIRYYLWRTAVGPLAGPLTAAAEELVVALRAAGVPTRVRKDVARSYATFLAAALPWALAIEDNGFEPAALARDRTRCSLAGRAAHEALALIRKRTGQGEVVASLIAAASGCLVRLASRVVTPPSLTSRVWTQVMWNHLRKIAAQDRKMLADLYHWGRANGEKTPALETLVGKGRAGG